MPTAESIRVVVQARPLLPFETLDGAQNVLALAATPPRVNVQRPAAADVCFDSFDAVYNAQSSERPDALYDTHVVSLVDGLFTGFNATVFAYGQTSAGKSYTMAHVTERVAEQLFEGKRRLEAEGKVNVTVRVGFVEIYRENIRDLVDGARAPLGTVAVQVRERKTGSGKGTVFLDGARERCVHEEKELMAIIKEGALVRQTASTGMNASSSRSHSVITITVQQEPVGDAQASSDACLAAKLHLVDLAGSERAKRTAVVGTRFAEGVQINKGLFALAKVISALADNARKGTKAHIPYRDSKLTRLLQDSLGGNARTLLIACVSPADTSREETLGTLRYATRAKSIKNRPRVNTELNSVEVSDLRASLARSRAEIAALAAENERLRQNRCTCPHNPVCTPPSTSTVSEDSASPQSQDSLGARENIVVNDLKFRIAELESLLDKANQSRVQRVAIVEPKSNQATSRSPVGKARKDVLTTSSQENVRAPRRRTRPGKTVGNLGQNYGERAITPLETERVRRTYSERITRRQSPPALTLGDSTAALPEEEDADDLDARVANALSSTRMDEMRRTFTQRLGQTETDKAALDRERNQLKKKLSTLQERHEKEIEELRTSHQARLAAIRGKLSDVKRLEGECVRLRKLHDGEGVAKKVLLKKIAAAEASRDEMAARLADALNRGDAIKREAAKGCREWSRSERTLRSRVQRAENEILKHETLISRLRMENESMKRKIKTGRLPVRSANTNMTASTATTSC